MDMAVTRTVAGTASRRRIRLLLIRVIMGAALIEPIDVHAQGITDWEPFVAEASARFGVPTAWINRVMQAESRGRTTLHGRPITSSAGAMGLMQLMPVTWSTMRTELRLGTDPYDPHDNILAGVAYLRILYDRFGYPGLFDAYNAGPTRYANYLATGRPLPTETTNYVAAIAGRAAVTSATPPGKQADQLFVTLATASHRSDAGADTATARGMFVTLSHP